MAGTKQADRRTPLRDDWVWHSEPLALYHAPKYVGVVIGHAIGVQMDYDSQAWVHRHALCSPSGDPAAPWCFHGNPEAVLVLDATTPLGERIRRLGEWVSRVHAYEGNT